MIEKIRAMKFRTVMLLVAFAILFPQLLVAAGETRFFDMIVRNAMSIGTTSAANSKTVLDVVSTTKASRPAPSMTTVQRDAITSPATGSLVYNTDTNKLNQYNGSGWVEVGSGSGQGGVNHITNSDAETNTDGHTLYADAAAASPVDGTAGTSSLTLSQDTAAELRGNASFKLAKSATSEQGEGVGINFTVALADYNPPKVQTISFDYKVSANFACNAGTAASPSDIVVYIYGRDTGALIQPSPFTLDCSGKFVGHFQPLTTDDDYRLILHVATTNASAWDFYYDSVTVGPLNTARGPPVTDWQSSGNGVTASVRGSSNESVYTNSTLASFKWRRIGDHMEVSAIIQFTGAPATGTGGISLAIDGVTLDSNKISGGIRNGTAAFFDSSAAAWYSGIARILSGTSRILVNSSITDGAGYASGDVSPSVPVTIANGDELHLRFSVPITGWASNVTIGQLDDGRVVTAHASLSTAQTGVADKVIPFNNESIDTHSAFNSSTGVFTVPVTGWYSVRARALLTALDGATNATIAVRKNSVAVNQAYCSVLTAGATSSGMCHVAEILSLVAGDTIDIYADGDASFDIDSSSSRTAVSIARISGPVTPMAAETVAVIASTTAGQALSAATPTTIVWGTETLDTHGAHNSSTGVFTAPSPGNYLMCVSWSTATTTFSINDEVATIFRKNSVDVYRDSIFANYSAGGTLLPLYSCHTFTLNAGDTLDARANSDKATSIVTTGTRNSLNIIKVGNF